MYSMYSHLDLPPLPADLHPLSCLTHQDLQRPSKTFHTYCRPTTSTRQKIRQLPKGTHFLETADPNDKLRLWLPLLVDKQHKFETSDPNKQPHHSSSSSFTPNNLYTWLSYELDTPIYGYTMSLLTPHPILLFSSPYL